MFNQLDGDYESVQPMILTHPNMLELVEQQQRAFRDESDPKVRMTSLHTVLKVLLAHTSL